jgi:hypothetical protein
MVDFLVSRSDLRQARFEPSTPAAQVALEPGQVLLEIDKFALTSNNITYAVFGDAMAYWNFFPGPAGWGRIPVWGYASVARSRHDGVAEGERVYGYLPMSTRLVVQPDRVSDGTFMDASPHRRQLPAPYQRYQNVSRLPAYAAAREDFHPLLVPLYATSFLIDDFLADHDLFGARSIVLSSASSKTAFGLAFLLQRARRAEVIGLTSPGNVAFCEKLGCYNRVVRYDEIGTLDARAPTVFVDMAGDGRVLHDVHHHFRDSLKHSCIVGASHWDRRETQHALPGAKPAFFFAPNQIKKRNQDWGAGGVDQRFAEVWAPFVEWVRPWMRIVHSRGQEAVHRTYLQMLDGKASPEEGHILSLQ